METPGGIIRHTRVARGWGVEELASITKLQARIVHLIEDDRYDDLPRGAYVRGYLRLIARPLGLDEGALLRSFEALVVVSGQSALSDAAAGAPLDLVAVTRSRPLSRVTTGRPDPPAADPVGGGVPLVIQSPLSPELRSRGRSRYAHLILALVAVLVFFLAYFAVIGKDESSVSRSPAQLPTFLESLDVREPAAVTQ